MRCFEAQAVLPDYCFALLGELRDSNKLAKHAGLLKQPYRTSYAPWRAHALQPVL